MAETEYISLNPQQHLHGKKNLLYAEMELLTTIKRYQSYIKLRKQEFAIKRLMKKKFDELHDIIKNFDELLPRTKQDQFKPLEINRTRKKRKDLESEIEAIKRKIAGLQ